ncbi:MAG TPA: N-acetylmuramoyl-L-alanine amidase [Candidatus Sulfotelmatobacter sp.]|nr:N-acetylmuramoyl-L-alanine amidase [Candidatus Sulfotelmatobacter sp.]
MRRMSGRSDRGTACQFTIWAVIAACSLALAGPAQGMSVARKKHLALDQYHKALQMREALNGRSERQRTSDDYDRVIEAFRKVYHVAPTCTRADASVLAVGDLLTEQARLNDDEKGFKSAIGQYQFLGREYPGSKYRFEALLSIGQIYREDLGDDDQAKTTFEEFLKQYPRQPLAENAKAALKEMAEEAKHPKENGKTEVASSGHRETLRRVTDEQVDSAAPLKPVSKRRGLPLVTSVRYWSTPDYTRIAIDLDDEVKYEAGRVPSPDRIYFDLYNSRLASELIGKSYDIEDGLLKKVRVAQYKSNMARVVLEVDNLAEYSAFLLPNPYRLIIDVHGRKLASQIETASARDTNSDDRSNSVTGIAHARITKHVQTKTWPIAAKDAQAQDVSGEKPRESVSTSASLKAPPIPPRAEVPLQSSDLGLAEIAALSEDPQQVKATSSPTSGPVVQNVTPRDSQKKAAETVAPSTSLQIASKASPKSTKKKSIATASAGHEAAPTADGDLSLIRALGLKIGRIVVDAGHGGHDTGTIGPNGLLEKDLVLDVALRLGKLLEQKLGADVVYTRQDDTFIPLETRTAIANQNQADLFISIHANSSRDASARGVETYYLNFTRSPEALEVAARENAVSDTSVHELQDLVKKIALKEKIDESREFAVTVQRALYSGEAAKNPGVKDRGIKKAPFIVLIGANMPSILAEISFVSNPTDERKLRTPEYRQRIAESLYRGIARYAQGLSGVKVASARPNVTTGQ